MSAKAARTLASAIPLSTQYARLAVQWPIDPLRPAQFSALLERRKALFETPVDDSTSSFKNVIYRRPSAAEEALETKRLDGLVGLLENRAAKANPIPESLLRPESNPNYYVNLMKDIEKVPNRTKAESWWLRITGKIRLR